MLFSKLRRKLKNLAKFCISRRSILPGKRVREWQRKKERKKEQSVRVEQLLCDALSSWKQTYWAWSDLAWMAEVVGTGRCHCRPPFSFSVVSWASLWVEAAVVLSPCPLLHHGAVACWDGWTLQHKQARCDLWAFWMYHFCVILAGSFIIIRSTRFILVFFFVLILYYTSF